MPAGRRQEESNAITAYKEFPERSHYTIGQPGLEEVADYALNWALRPTASTGVAPMSLPITIDTSAASSGRGGRARAVLHAFIITAMTDTTPNPP